MSWYIAKSAYVLANIIKIICMESNLILFSAEKILFFWKYTNELGKQKIKLEKLIRTDIFEIRIQEKKSRAGILKSSLYTLHKHR